MWMLASGAARSAGSRSSSSGTEDSEQVDWQVKITRIVWRRRRYRRRCSHRGPATVCAPPAARPVPKGLFTAGFLARLAYEKHVLGRPVHRIVQALAADGLDVAAGTLCGALKQVAPLIAPWAAAIAAHGRTRPGMCMPMKPAGRCSRTSRIRTATGGGLPASARYCNWSGLLWFDGFGAGPGACLTLLPAPDRCRVLRAAGRVKGRGAPA